MFNKIYWSAFDVCVKDVPERHCAYRNKLYVKMQIVYTATYMSTISGHTWEERMIMVILYVNDFICKTFSYTE